MIRFFPIMFASGRVAHNRMVVTIMDFIALYALYLSYDQKLHWCIAISFWLILAAFYTHNSYTRYFIFVRNNNLIKTNIAFESGSISIDLYVNNNRFEDGSERIAVPIKVPMGQFYQHYVLYVYMNLCSALTFYARELKKKEKI